MADLCVGIRGAESLKDELARVRENLRDTDATIEKLTGRPATFASRPFQRFQGQSRYGADEGRGRGRALPFPGAGFDNSGPPPAKRPPTGTFGRLGLPVGGGPRSAPARRNRDDDDDEELPHKPAIASSVVATPKDTKTREEAIAEQQSGAGGAVGQTRNRRMFGLLLGTLARFRQDEQTKEKEKVKRKAVEQRLEEKQHEERERLVRERQQLFLDRRRQQAKMRALEHKIELVEMHEGWETETRNLECFIRTNARPHLFFLPRTHIPTSFAKLEESKRVLQSLVAERRKQLEEEIEEIMARGDRDREEEEEEESGHELDDSVAGREQKVAGGRAAKAVDERNTLSDIEDHDHEAIEYGLRADVIGNTDTVEMPREPSAGGGEQLAMNVDDERDKQAETPMEIGDSEERTAAARGGKPEEAGRSRDRDADRRGGARDRRRHGDGSSRRRDEREGGERSHRRERRRRDDRDEDDRSKRREHRHDQDDSRKRRDRHGDDDRARDRRHAKHRDSSRHGKEDVDEDKRRHDREKNDEPKRKPHESQEDNGDKVVGESSKQSEDKVTNEAEEGEIHETVNE